MSPLVQIIAALRRYTRETYRVRTVSACLLSLLLISAAGCSAMKNWVMPQGVKLDWDVVSMQVIDGANRDFPLAIDVVMVSDDALAQRLSSMSARDWFAARDSLRKAYPDTLEFDSLELAPGESITQPGKRWSGRRVSAALLFADYFADGPHLARLESLKGRLYIEFGATDFSVSATEK